MGGIVINEKSQAELMLLQKEQKALQNEVFGVCRRPNEQSSTEEQSAFAPLAGC
jgi:hypothetical protein